MTGEMRITFVLAPRETQEEMDDALRILLRALVDVDRAWMRQNPDAPRLYDAGIRYEPEPMGQEEWLDTPSLYRKGVGDCEDLATTRAAELQERDGIDAGPYIDGRAVRMQGRDVNLMHAQVEWPSGYVEDPSHKLGMPKGGR